MPSLAITTYCGIAVTSVRNSSVHTISWEINAIPGNRFAFAIGYAASDATSMYTPVPTTAMNTLLNKYRVKGTHRLPASWNACLKLSKVGFFT